MQNQSDTQFGPMIMLERLLVILAFLVYIVWRLPKLLQLPAVPLIIGREVSVSFILPMIFVLSLIRVKFNAILILFIFISSVEFWYRNTMIPVLYIFQWWMLLVVMVQVGLKKTQIFSRYMISPWLAAYAIYGLASYLRDPILPTWGSLQNTVGAMSYFKFFSLMLFFVTFPIIFDDKRLRMLPLYILICSLAVIILQSALYAASAWQLGLLFGVRPRNWDAAAISGRWAFLHQSALMAVISSLAIWHGKRRLSWAAKTFLLTIAAVSFLALLFTGTRIWAFGVVVIASVIFYWNRNFKLILIGVGLWLIAAFIISNIYVARATEVNPVLRSFWIPWLASEPTASQSMAQSTWTWRVELWEIALDQIRKQPLWGVGFRQNPYIYSRLMSGVADSETFAFEQIMNLSSGGTHQLWLGPFTSFGIPGGIFFLLYYFERMIAVIRMRRDAKQHNDLYPAAVIITAILVYVTVIGPVDGGTISVRFFFAAALSHIMQETLRQRQMKESSETQRIAASDSASVSGVSSQKIAG